MYIFFEKKTGIFQIGFRHISKISLLHGVFLHEDYVKDFSSIKTKNVYLFYSNKTFFENNSCFIKDYRYHVKSIYIRKIIFFGFKFLSLFFKILNEKKYKNKLKITKWIFFTLPFLIFIYNFSFVSIKMSNHFVDQDEETLLSDVQNLEWDQEKLLDFFLNTKIADEISKNKNSFYSGQALKVKGISDFKSIPLIKKNDEKYEYRGYFAASYKKIISLYSNQNSYFKYPEISCNNGGKNEISVFQISQDDLLIIVRENEKIKSNSNDTYFIFPDNYFSKDKICEYFNKNNET